MFWIYRLPHHHEFRPAKRFPFLLLFAEFWYVPHLKYFTFLTKTTFIFSTENIERSINVDHFVMRLNHFYSPHKGKFTLISFPELNSLILLVVLSNLTLGNCDSYSIVFIIWIMFSFNKKLTCFRVLFSFNQNLLLQICDGNSFFTAHFPQFLGLLQFAIEMMRFGHQQQSSNDVGGWDSFSSFESPFNYFLFKLIFKK